MDFPPFLTTVARCSARAAVLALSAHLLATAPGALQSSGSPQSASAVTPHAAQQADPALVPFRNPTELDGFVTPAAVTSLIATFELSAAESAIAWELFRGYAAKVDALDREAVKAIDEGGRHEANALWENRPLAGVNGIEPPSPEFMQQSEEFRCAFTRVSVDYLRRGDLLVTEFLTELRAATSVGREDFESIAGDAILFEAQRITNAPLERTNGDDRVNWYTDALRLLEAGEREEINSCIAILNKDTTQPERAGALRSALVEAAVAYRTSMVEVARGRSEVLRNASSFRASARQTGNPTLARHVGGLMINHIGAVARLIRAVDVALQNAGCEASLVRVWKERAWGAFAPTAYRKPITRPDIARWIAERKALPEEIRQAILENDGLYTTELDALRYTAAQCAYYSAIDWTTDDGARSTDRVYATALAATWKLQVAHIQRTLALLPAPFRAELRKELGEEPPFHPARFAVFGQPTLDWLIERRLLPSDEKWF